MNHRKWNSKVNGLTVLALVAAGVVGFPHLSKGELVHRWSFNDGTANDSAGLAHGTLYGTASITNGRLRLSGSSGNNRMEATLMTALGTNKTLVAWCTLSSLTPNNPAGGPLSVGNAGMTVFDAIVLGERNGNQWMNGSDSWRRSGAGNNGGVIETLTEPSPIMMAITYDLSVNKITIYRNGAPYATYTPANPLEAYLADGKVRIGPRYLANGYMNGYIDEARIYDTALSSTEIAALYTEGPNPTVDLAGLRMRHRWSFDGDAKDSVGTAYGAVYTDEAGGVATITNGYLLLAGSNGRNRMETAALGYALTNKTLVSWCTLDTPSVQYSGAVLSVAEAGAFDGIVYAEIAPRRWMNGSEIWNRSLNGLGGTDETAATPTEIMMAVVYDSAASQKIKVYRNATPYVIYTNAAVKSFTAAATALIGPRVTVAGYINGRISEARIYGQALSAQQLGALYAQGPDSGSVWTQAAGGGWDRGVNWTNLFAAGGTGQTADFGTLDITADATVSVNGTRTIGKLVFADTVPSHDWTLAGGSLKLDRTGSQPEIAVSNRTAKLAVPLSGTNGFVKTGAGTLCLSATSVYQGPTVIAEGTLSLLDLDVPIGTVAAYTFDEAGNLGRDNSGQGNTLQASSGSPQYSASGRFGGALNLTGSYFMSPLSGQFPTGVPTGAAPYTVSAFIRADQAGNTGGGWIGYGNAANNQCNSFRLNGNFTNIWNYWYNNDMGAALPSGSLTDGWHSVVGTWDGIKETLYMDGVERSSRLMPTPPNIGSGNFYLGRSIVDVRLLGLLDEVLFAKRAFSQEEITALHTSGFKTSARLPSATTVRVAAGAAINLNNTTQLVAGLSGSGLVTNSAALTVSSTLTPGDSLSAVAVLTVSSNLTLSAGATLAYDYNTVTSDTVRVTGTLAVQGACTVQLSAISSAPLPSRLTLCTFGALTGSENLASWTVLGNGLAGKQVRVRSDASSVYVTISPKGSLIMFQ